MFKKQWVNNIVYTATIIGLYIIATNLIRNYQVELSSTYNVSYIYISTIYLICYGGIGMVLSLEKFFVDLKKAGNWKVNSTKIIILGVPSFILIMPITKFTSESTITMASIVFGYTILASIYKE